MKINFDDKGHLFPYELIECDWDTFSTRFVLNFPKTSSRYKLLSELDAFLMSIKILINSNIEVWINGSFTTTKQNPKDIDIVLFIPNHLITNDLKELIYTNQRIKNKHIDAYIVEHYEENTPNYFFYESDKKYWFFQFNYTAPNRKKERFPKGILKLLL